MANVIATERPKSDDAARIVPVRHNWASAYRISSEYKTDITVSENGKEQRRAVRYKPRWSVELQANLARREKQAFDYLMHGWQSKRMILGLEPLSLLSTEILAPESETQLRYRSWNGGNVPFWLEDGQTIVLADGKDPAIRETRTLAGFTFQHLEFEETTVGTFAMHSQMMVGYDGWLAVEQATNRAASNTGTTNLTFQIRPQNQLVVPDTLVDRTFEGPWEVWTRKPNWANGVEVDHVWFREPIDYGYGVVGQYRPIPFPARVNKLDFIGRSITETYGDLAFFNRHRGMCNEFLAPTWENDVPYTSLSTSRTDILIDGTAFGTIYQDSTVFRRIMVRYRDGTNVFAKVEQIEPLPDTASSVLRVTDPLPNIPLSPETIYGISWALVTRFAADRMDVDFVTNEVAQYTLAMQSLENFEL